MVLKPVEKTTPPAQVEPTQAPDDDADLPPAYISIDGDKSIFPAAKLKLQPLDEDVDDGRLVRVTLFSTAQKDKTNSFYFAMDLVLPETAEGELRLSADDLAYAEWYLPAGESVKTDQPSGIVLVGDLGRELTLQPVEVSVSFSPHSADTTVVQLVGDFAEFEQGAAVGTPATKQVAVQAVLATDTIVD